MSNQLIDNDRSTLKEFLLDKLSSESYKQLSIATGYWDLHGMVELINYLDSFDSIRILIGKEPIPDRLQKSYSLDLDNPEALFPDENFAYDLQQESQDEELNEKHDLRETARKLAELLKSGIIEVKVFRKPRLHAKTYIFGNYESNNAVGIIGSSNFTYAGLNTNLELNYVEDDSQKVTFQPLNNEQCHGHLSWFEQLWNDREAIDWGGDFSEVIEKSPLGGLTYGPYDVYIKTLMEMFPDEIYAEEEKPKGSNDVLLSFQDRNARLLINKLNRIGIAMLSDSVGLGKTVTAGAVIKHFRLSGAKRVVVIAPASLKEQWRNDLAQHLDLQESDFEIVSMQNISEIEKIKDNIERKNWIREIDLFVIDEAHNLRTPSSKRYKMVRELLEVCPKAPVLMLTATPINNSLMDFASQIQLAARGSLTSVPVQMLDSSNNLNSVDFFVALKTIQSEIRQAENKGEVFDWSKYESTLKNGIRHYLVRSTRQGVENEGAMFNDGRKLVFPKTRVEQIKYGYSENSVVNVRKCLAKYEDSIFNHINPLTLDLNKSAEITQLSLHPIDFFNIDNENQYFTKHDSSTFIPSIFQIINFLGFVPYRGTVYKHVYYGKTKKQIQDLGISEEEKRLLTPALIVHNLLRITWLKRLESSIYALSVSVTNYKKRLSLFKKYIDKGYVISLSDIDVIENIYGDDLERAFDDYDGYIARVQHALDNDKSVEDIEKVGVKKEAADKRIFNLEAIYKDIERDMAICDLLDEILQSMMLPEFNGKVQEFAKNILNTLKAGNHGNKVLVFSFFADTIDYLEKYLPDLLSDIPNFNERSAFLTGKNINKSESIVNRFAPKGKGYPLKENENEIDFLFATDVLSEGQNLQDSGYLINYDLHWNPVRMIQRNGRINRLGSEFNEVMICNMNPHEDLELYLQLVKRLERKINTIKNSIGTDQSVLGETENPKEFIGYFSDDVEEASKSAEKIEHDAQGPLNDFSSDDDYIFDLRHFVKDHLDDASFKRVVNIPYGKWNYFPSNDTNINRTYSESVNNIYNKNSYLFLEKVKGRNLQDESEFFVTLFYRLYKKEGSKYIQVENVEDLDALSVIRTTPDDNKPIRDTIPITINRAYMVRRANSTAKNKTEKQDFTRKLKPSERATLQLLQTMLGSKDDLLGLVEKGITRKQDEDEFKKIVQLVRKQQKFNGNVKVSIITRFQEFIEHLKNLEHSEQIAESTECILVYANRC